MMMRTSNMIFKRKHTVTFYSPGTLFSESTTKEIDSWDTKKAVEMADSVMERYNAKPYAFVFRTLKTHDDVSDGDGGFLKVEAKKEKESGYYFLGGKLVTWIARTFFAATCVAMNTGLCASTPTVSNPPCLSVKTTRSWTPLEPSLKVAM